jgi:hypothetical protein
LCFSPSCFLSFFSPFFLAPHSEGLSFPLGSQELILICSLQSPAEEKLLISHPSFAFFNSRKKGCALCPVTFICGDATEVSPPLPALPANSSPACQLGFVCSISSHPRSPCIPLPPAAIVAEHPPVAPPPPFLSIFFIAIFCNLAST